MADCMKLAEKELYTLLLESVGRAVAAGTLPAEPMNAFKIEVPADKSHGDFAANIAMVNAKAFRMPPRLQRQFSTNCSCRAAALKRQKLQGRAS